MKFSTIIPVLAAFALAAPRPNPGIGDGVVNIVSSSLTGGAAGGINKGVKDIVSSTTPSAAGNTANSWIDFGFSWVPSLF